MEAKIFNTRVGEWITLTESDIVFIGRCGSGRTVFGEHAKLHKILSNHLVFKTESGALVKTNECLQTVGKAKDYFVSMMVRSESEFIKQGVSYWNSKKLCFEYK